MTYVDDCGRISASQQSGNRYDYALIFVNDDFGLRLRGNGLTEAERQTKPNFNQLETFI